MAAGPLHFPPRRLFISDHMLMLGGGWMFGRELVIGVGKKRFLNIFLSRSGARNPDYLGEIMPAACCWVNRQRTLRREVLRGDFWNLIANAIFFPIGVFLAFPLPLTIPCGRSWAVMRCIEFFGNNRGRSLLFHSTCVHWRDAGGWIYFSWARVVFLYRCAEMKWRLEVPAETWNIFRCNLTKTKDDPPPCVRIAWG